jgi:RHS repeat-associated protein
VQLTWTQVPAAVAAPAEYEYAVYRLTFDAAARYFYRTQVVEATSCVDGVCTYVETGDLQSPNLHMSDPNLDCPYRSSSACASTGTQAFYVTVRRKAVGSEPKGGESPRSQVVFWDCTLGDLSRAEPEEEDAVFFASAQPDAVGPPADLAVCEAGAENEDVILAQSPRPLDAGPALAPLLFLGQTPPPIESPGYRVIDLHVDHLGSVRLTTDELGQVTARHDFLPFGEEINPIVPSPDANTKMFTGHERDRETGMDYMMARYHDVGLFRFLAADSSEPGNDSDPQSWNLYAYVLNNPLAYLDPLGEDVVYSVKAEFFLQTAAQIKAQRAVSRKGHVGGDWYLDPNDIQAGPNTRTGSWDVYFDSVIKIASDFEAQWNDILGHEMGHQKDFEDAVKEAGYQDLDKRLERIWKRMQIKGQKKGLSQAQTDAMATDAVKKKLEKAYRKIEKKYERKRKRRDGAKDYWNPYWWVTPCEICQR